MRSMHALCKARRGPGGTMGVPTSVEVRGGGDLGVNVHDKGYTQGGGRKRKACLGTHFRSIALLSPRT